MDFEDAGASRRRFLRAGGGALLVGLAGCSGDGGGDVPTRTATDGTPSRTDPGTPTGTATDGPAGTTTATETGTPTPREPAFVPLFDGSSLSGWHRVFGNAEYAVRDGDGDGEPYIEGVGGPETSTSFLSTYEVFDDFVLELELWIDPDGLNSGIMVQCNTSQENQKLHGPQVEAEQSTGGSGYVYGTEMGTGFISDGEDHDVFNNGEWNQFEIRFEGNRLRTWVNDERIEDLDLGQYDLVPMGIVALQVHGGSPERREVRFRNVRIKELDVAEWTRLFNGRNTAGWTTRADEESVSVSDGQLHLEGDRPVYLFSEDAFDDFVFETWVKADAEGGILFRNPGVNAVEGYRAEIDPSENTLSGSLYHEAETTWLESIEGEPHSQFAFKPGEWNYYRIVANGDALRVWVNGITTAEITDGSHGSGRIGLTHRGGDGAIRFRDVEIKPLGGGAN
jgi:hypothetical protein